MTSQDMSVLLVDDDPHACAIFELVMNHYQLPIRVVDNAESAITYLQSNTPDIVVMDIFLPGLDGYQALKQIRKTAADPNCPVVATTAYYTNDTQQEIMNRGFDGYLPKPFDSSQLVSFLRSVAGK
ncbi:MAG: response regulator [Anaerolineae bacterium]|nr:response regulator [Anaerolineae bacterium]